MGEFIDGESGEPAEEEDVIRVGDREIGMGLTKRSR